MKQTKNPQEKKNSIREPKNVPLGKPLKEPGTTSTDGHSFFDFIQQTSGARGQAHQRDMKTPGKRSNLSLDLRVERERLKRDDQASKVFGVHHPRGAG